MRLLFFFFTFFCVCQHLTAQEGKAPSLIENKPRVTIITSVYKCQEYIREFLEDMTQQTIYPECEHILIDADSPENEREVIFEFMQKHPNIIYVRLPKDPGLYAVWNYAISIARAPYITNANPDDRLEPRCYQMYVHTLDTNPEVDLVYSGYLITQQPNETFAKNSAKQYVQPPEFSRKNMRLNLPNNHPMWRKSLHEKYGYFDESFKIGADWDMWCKSTAAGAQFKRIPLVLGLYYQNPKGLSTNASDPAVMKEHVQVLNKYSHLWQ